MHASRLGPTFSDAQRLSFQPLPFLYLIQKREGPVMLANYTFSNSRDDL